MKSNLQTQAQQKETGRTEVFRKGRSSVAFVGFCTTLLLSLTPASAATRYVWQESPSPAPPYDSWANAATNIQEAVDAADPGDTVLVTNGVYATGGRAVYGTMTNRVVVSEGVEVRSVNGQNATWIEGLAATGDFFGNGDGAIRCAYVGTNAVLSGFTLTNGHTITDGDDLTERSGGSAWCEPSGVVANCILTGNSALWGGGGSYSGTLNNCILTGNSVGSAGGGAYRGTLNNCTVTGNGAGGSMYSTDGGVLEATLNNCIVYYNLAPAAPNGGGTFNYSCTTPLPVNGIGNITNPPLFIDTNGWSNLRLQTNSPCINSGNNAHVTSPTDLDGNPRIVSSTVDIGAYEYQGPGSLISYAWLQQYGLPTDGSADTLDADLDGHSAWQE